MANKTYYFSGIAKWAKVYEPDTKFGVKYLIDLYLDPASIDAFGKSGSRLELRESDEGSFIKLSRSKYIKNKEGVDVDQGPPAVVDNAGVPMTDLIGNGSKVTCQVEVFDTKKYGKGTKLIAVRVDELVPFTSGPTEAKWSAPKETVPV